MYQNLFVMLRALLCLVLFSISVVGTCSVQDFRMSVDVYYDFGSADDSSRFSGEKTKIKGGTTRLMLNVNESVSFNYDFGFSVSDQGIRNFHTPVGAVAGPPILGIGLLSLATCNTDEDSTSASSTNVADTTDECNFCSFGAAGVLIGAAITLIPDGVSFHLRPTNWLSISPYANFIGMDFVKNRSTGEKDLVYAASFGSALTIRAGSFRISGKYELRTRKTMGYAHVFGVGIGAAF